MNCTDNDLQTIAKQLGREPRNVVEVSQSCSRDYPQVIVTAPILAQEDKLGIFPTTFWLTCPELNYRIDKLEAKGWIQKIQDRLQTEEELAAKLDQAHQSYAQYRMDLLSPARKERLAKDYPERYRVLEESGVGGILEFGGIKCLHTHYAHYLAIGENPVGKLVDQLLTAEFTSLSATECVNNCQVEGSNCDSEQLT
ncbi:DUF501 domain-containing protein [Halanaerobaculum tunisiense]